MFTIYQKRKQLKTTRCAGSVLADAPGAIWLLFIGLAFPAMCYASLFYRATLVYFATRDSCYKAAKSSTFSNALTNASSAFSTDMGAFTGISGTETLYIVTQPIAGGSATTSTTVLGSVNTTNNVYFIKAITNAVVNPLFNVGPSWMGTSIPGLTGPYNLTVTSEFYAENPTGLTN